MLDTLIQIKKRAIITIVFIMIFYVALVVYSDATQLLHNLKNIDLLLIFPILLSVTASIFIKSLRQYFLLKRLNLRVPLKQNIVIYLASLSMLATPASIGGVIKSKFFLRKFNIPISKTIPIVIVERYHDVLALFSFIVLFSILGNFEVPKIPILAIGIILLVLVIIAKNKAILNFIIRKIDKVRFLKFLTKDSKFDFVYAFPTLLKNKNIVMTWMLSCFAWSFDSLGIYLCFNAFKLNFDFISTTAIGLTSLLFGSLSFLPGGVGLTELSFVKFLISRGQDLATASALVLFIRLTSIWYCTCVGFIAIKPASK